MITLATLPNATAQEVFDQVATHLLTQNQRAVNTIYTENNPPCVYHSSKGLKCAAGCLISTEEIKSFSGLDLSAAWGSLIQNNTVPDTHYRLISDLQRIHDIIAIDDWAKELAALAKDQNLVCVRSW